ncbi:MAG TPA: hypothetical protein VNM69_03845 [Bacillus sp. (in: firmicutes)]|nr:hypothetical protein [Bacillus sp. (in: firmicutes)]
MKWLHKFLFGILALCSCCFSQLTFVQAEEINFKEAIQTEVDKQSSNSEDLIDQEEIMKKSEQIDPERIVQKARDGSFTLVYYALIILGALIIIGFIFKPVLKFAAAYTVCIIVGYFFINDTDSVAAVLFYIIDEIEAFFIT